MDNCTSINKSVSLNMNIRGMGPSATLAINEISKKLQKDKKAVYRLGLGQSPFPVPVPVVDALKANAEKKDYLSPRGLPELRESVSEFHHRKDGLNVKPEHVLIGPGSKELMFLLQLVYYGEILIPSPCWVSYIPQARIIGRQVQIIPTRFEDRWKVTAEGLDRICGREKDRYRPRILILNYPANPDGCTYTDGQLRDLAEVAKKYQILILSDEIYGQLHHRGLHISVARYYPEGTILSSGISKWCGAGGWRLGTFTFPAELEWLLDAMAAVASETYTSVSAPIQFAAVHAFLNDQRIERYLWHVRRVLCQLGMICYDMLSRAGMRVWAPEGGFYLFPDFSPYRDHLEKRGITGGAEQLCERLLEETGVAVLPGSAFARPPDELSARMAYVDFDGAKALTASETVPLDRPLPDNFSKQIGSNVIQAVEIMIEWIRQ
ncbi:MAG: pyridoxal phosphate-dependent aminotransferase [Spirochaetes bacterium]|nr:pyridoxal phosphate-dependent aminotransferase [Spirochaetota bacterium]